MPELEIPMTKASTELVPAALWQLSWKAGIEQSELTDGEAALVVVSFKAKDVNGNWSTDYDATTLQMQDEKVPVVVDEGLPTERTEMQWPEFRMVYHAFGLMLDAIIPEDDPRAIAMGVGGKTVREMGEMLVAMKLQGG